MSHPKSETEEETITISRYEQSLYIEIGRRIRAERDALGFSQLDLAHAVRLTRTSIANIESGRQRLPIFMLYAIAEALAIPVSALLPTTTP